MTLWCADTSVVVPLVLVSHEAHEVVDKAVGRRRVRLPFHAAIESYSVLTRLPGDARLLPADAQMLLADRFGTPVGVPADEVDRLLPEFAAGGVAGGAAYDALIAFTAREAKAVLLTRDRRAAATYARLGAAYELVA